jgi:hypothetical protein
LASEKDQQQSKAFETLVQIKLKAALVKQQDGRKGSEY